MTGIWYVISAETLQDIGYAVRFVTNISGYIPVNSLADALAGNPVETTEITLLSGKYLIKLQTLINIANVVRAKDGTTEPIAVGNLAARIRALATGDAEPRKSVYYGTAEEPAVYNDEFLLGLTEKKLDSKQLEFTVNADDDEYIYYCVPAYGSGFGECTFYESGFKGGFTLVSTIRFTSSAYPESYYIYRSDNPGLGETTIKVV